MNAPKIFTAVRLAPSQLAALEKLAKTGDDTTVSSLIRDAISAFIAKRSK